MIVGVVAVANYYLSLYKQHIKISDLQSPCCLLTLTLVDLFPCHTDFRLHSGCSPEIAPSGEVV